MQLFFLPYPWDGPWGIERIYVNDRQFSRFLIILVVGFFLLHIPLAFYYAEFLSKWSYEIWMAFLGVILISGVFQVPNESDYHRAVQSSFLSSLILLGQRTFQSTVRNRKHYQKPFFVLVSYCLAYWLFTLFWNQRANCNQCPTTHCSRFHSTRRIAPRSGPLSSTASFAVENAVDTYA